MSSVAYQSSPAETEDSLSARDFQRISGLINAKVGIKLPSAKRSMTEGRLRKRMRATGLSSLHDYCKWLFDGDGLAAELPHLIDAVTTNKTDFFREPEHYVHLAKTLVPSLVQSRHETMPLIKIWSAASSNGAEAYTAAMVLSEMLRQNRNFRYAVLGTDVSTAVLAQGRRAVYPADLMAPVSADLQQRYVMRARRPGSRAEVRIVPELRRQVRFRHLNLMDKAYPIDKDVDVIFLRNVLIYFERPVQEAVIGRLTDHLRPGGYLLLGHSESMIGTGFQLNQIAPAIFQKK